MRTENGEGGLGVSRSCVGARDEREGEIGGLGFPVLGFGTEREERESELREGVKSTCHTRVRG